MKLILAAGALAASVVAPLVGAWIEMARSILFTGLKSVAPLVGAWIEIELVNLKIIMLVVAPLVGAWIEILFLMSIIEQNLSLLSWERGLK